MINTQLPNTTRVWIYQSQTELSADLQATIQKDLNLFISNWAAHGNELHGDAFIVENYFIVLAVDESKVGASGCSIDSSTRFIKQLEKSYGISLLNRLYVLTELDGKKEIVHFADVKDNANRFIYDPLVTTLGELRENWKVKVTDWNV